MLASSLLILAGPSDELAPEEERAGTDEGDRWGVDHPPLGLGGLRSQRA